MKPYHYPLDDVELTEEDEQQITKIKERLVYDRKYDRHEG